MRQRIADSGDHAGDRQHPPRDQRHPPGQQQRESLQVRQRERETDRRLEAAQGLADDAADHSADEDHHEGDGEPAALPGPPERQPRYRAAQLLAGNKQRTGGRLEEVARTGNSDGVHDVPSVSGVWPAAGAPYEPTAG